jgi:RNA polymerase sigma factor (sigma-70 family)
MGRFRAARPGRLASVDLPGFISSLRFALLYLGHETITTAFLVNKQTKRAFVTAVERDYGAGLRRFLSTRLRHASMDVPDIFQEIFMRLLRIKDHETIRNPQAYLFTVASHVLHQYALKRSMGPETMDPLELAARLPSVSAPDPADELDLAQQIAELAGALEKLSPRAYATLVLYRCEGMTLAEIGKRLGVSHTMARKYLTRAIVFCDHYLEERGTK